MTRTQGTESDSVQIVDGNVEASCSKEYNHDSNSTGCTCGSDDSIEDPNNGNYPRHDHELPPSTLAGGKETPGLFMPLEEMPAPSETLKLLIHVQLVFILFLGASWLLERLEAKKRESDSGVTPNSQCALILSHWARFNLPTSRAISFHEQVELCQRESWLLRAAANGSLQDTPSGFMTSD
ncbi:hypothetical protein B0H14DRAFT_3169598 [Mycena olivaceomarginata]|nr:hypothetical protein B0H14DRAFT_3169598 [Mycena olivaceomarginata]